MFGLGTGEVLFILLLVLLIYGPERVPEMAHKIGKGVRRIKSAGERARATLDREVAKLDRQEREQTEGLKDEAEKGGP